ncbi:hypothetical protein BO94DRAFT_601755 [Aspergillus sclerotioniger CBS 115572]|uniref:Uncharacterized protein n=1 Tax=Aspergillus sclerotioniger CBS 115572 TaxID=1450535 RepID=A0A317WC61_9EURO|nr:hypothetical protein BO94DRAFT_601755 [Aspergillus sclerotioniger CBS 115572]PWY81720.1 hypothetical protein BO94DRAFT_601755 [Aspergillus sclerotioniger CBS 115572]
MGQNVSTWNNEDPDVGQGRTHCLEIEQDRKNEVIPILIQRSNRWTEKDAVRAYRSLKCAVESLLQLESGNSRLSRNHPDIVDMLSDSVSKFEMFCQCCRETTADIGREMGDVIALMDGTTTFMRELKDTMNEINSFVPRMWGIINPREKYWRECRAAEPALRRAVSDAEEEKNNNSFLIWLNPPHRDILEGKIRAANSRLADNLRRQSEARSKYESSYRYAMVARNTSAALASLHDKLAPIATFYRDQYHRLLSVQSELNEQWQASQVLRNLLWDPDLSVSRDRSLQVINRFIDAHKDMSLDQNDTMRAIEYTVIGLESILAPRRSIGYDCSFNDCVAEHEPDLIWTI